MARDPLTIEIEWLTRGVRAVRIAREIRRQGMALEIKGLKANMLKVQKRIESINNLAAGFDEQGATLEQGLKDITAQVASHAEDLNFAATVLGNSTVSSGASDDVPAVKPPMGAQTESTVTSSPPEVGQSSTFPGN